MEPWVTWMGRGLMEPAGADERSQTLVVEVLDWDKGVEQDLHSRF